MQFRPPGSPAGTWPHTDWQHCTFLDPYERVNVWSHGIPGLVFLVSGLISIYTLSPKNRATFLPLAIFLLCASTTHLLSCLTHVYPDDHVLEKIDHIGIVALIVGTPLTAVMARRPGHPITTTVFCALALLICAAFPPTARTLGFVVVGAILVISHWFIMNPLFAVEMVLYSACALCFLRGQGHTRLGVTWLSDHHFLHYFTTSASLIHVIYILNEKKEIKSE